MLATARQLQSAASDDALDLLDQLLGSLLARAQRAGRQERLRTLPELDAAATHLRDAVAVLLDPPDGDLAAVCAAIIGKVSRAELEAAVAAVTQTTQPQVDTHLADLLARYSTVRRFLPALLTTMTFQAAPGGVDQLAAFTALAALEGRRTIRAQEVPLTLATGPWQRRCTNPDATLNRPAYTFLVLERLREALRRRDVYAPGSTRWGDPRAQLLTGPAWEAARPQVTQSLALPLDPGAKLTTLAAELDGAYRAVASRLADNDAVRIETADGRDRVVLTPLDRLEEPASLLRAARRRRRPAPAGRPTRGAAGGRRVDGLAHRVHPRLRRRRPGRRPRGQHLRGPSRRGLQHRPGTRRPARGERAVPEPAVLGRPELPARGHHHRGRRPGGRRPKRDRSGPSLGRRRGRQRRRPPLRRAGEDPERRAEPPLLRARARRDLPQLPVRPVRRVPRHRRPRHPARRPLHPGRPARAAGS